jgi:hypothetical protein
MAVGATAQAGVAGYVTNRAPLRPDAFLRLPPGAVRPAGWLATQLRYQLDGIAGRMTEISHFLQYDRTGWIRPELDGWEELPYWLKGFGDLGYVTGDQRVIAEARRWADGVMATQAADGYFGPSRLRTALNGGPDFWPHMPMLHFLRSHHEFTGEARIVPFFSRFFGFVHRQPTSVFSQSWGSFRWADTLDTVFWTYNRTGEPWLIDLSRKIHEHSANYVNNLPTLHNVNLAQGFREPAVFSTLSGDATHRTASYNVYNTIMNAYGQFPGGGFAGDEIARPGFGDPRQGFETCGIVEFMASHEILARITGDPVWGDRVEDLAFNSLPASLDHKHRGIHYITSANSIAQLDRPGTQGQFQNGFAMQAYELGIDNYRCCPHNYGQGWPYYVEEMWAATPDNGLAAMLHGPARVTAKVADGTTVTVTADTTYPFSDTVTFTVRTPRRLAFPLYLRIPGWCTAPVLQVNGTRVAARGGPAYARIHRTWSDRDRVTLRLPMQPRVRTWAQNHGAVSVDYGALTFSLAIQEEWRRVGGTDAWPKQEVLPASAWNYGLVLDGATPFQVATGVGSTTDPFTPAAAPIRITARAKRIPAWTADSEQIVTPLQDSPTPSDEPTQNITLLPMGAQRLRITSFPRIGPGKPWVAQGVQFLVQNAHSGKVLGVDGMSLENSAQVVQFDDNGTADHLWQLVDNGDGYARIRNAHSGKVLGVDRMSTANSAHVVQFSDNGTADHNWRLVPQRTVKLQATHTGKVLAIQDMSRDNGAQLTQWPATGTPDHVWRFVDAGDGYFRIVSHHSGKVVDVGVSTADGARAVQWDHAGSPHQQWRLAYGSPGIFALIARHSGKVLEVGGRSEADGAAVQQWTDLGLPNQRWRIIPG